MTTMTFDSLGYFEKLKAAGFTEEQAKAQATALREQTETQAAALQKALDKYDEASRKDLATKGDIQDVRLEMRPPLAPLRLPGLEPWPWSWPRASAGSDFRRRFMTFSLPRSGGAFSFAARNATNFCTERRVFQILRGVGQGGAVLPAAHDVLRQRRNVRLQKVVHGPENVRHDTPP